jgi:hypothetical protein
MSGMAFGAMIEADQRLRQHEVIMRTRKRIARDAEVWRRYEEDYQDQESAEAGSKSSSSSASK